MLPIRHALCTIQMYQAHAKLRKFFDNLFGRGYDPKTHRAFSACMGSAVWLSKARCASGKTLLEEIDYEHTGRSAVRVWWNRARSLGVNPLAATLVALRCGWIANVEPV